MHLSGPKISNQFLRPAVLVSSAILAVCTLLVIFRDGWLPLDRALLASAVICIGCMPSVGYLAMLPSHRPALPLMALCGIFYAVFFGFPCFLISNLTSVYSSQRINYYNLNISETISRESLALIVGGLLMMFGAWILGKRIVFARLPALKFGGFERISRAPEASVSVANDMASGVTLCLAMFLALANLAYWAVPSVRGMPSIGQFLQPAGYVAFALLYLLKANDRLPKWLTIVYFGAVLPLWVAGMAINGFLTPIILLVCLWVALRMHAFGSIPWKISLAGALVFVWIYPHIAEYRANYWRLQKDEPAIEKLTGFGNMLVERSLSDGWGTKFSTRPFQGLVQRLSLNLQFSTVVDKTPDRVPYWQGATYRSLFLSWVPRVVWKDKPEERWGNEFGRRYQFLAPENTSMSVNLPWLVELYANFGAKGVVIGMTLIGLLLAFLEQFLNRPESDTISKAVGAAVLLPLFYHESNFTVMTGSLLPLIVCLWIYFNVPARMLARRGN
jgi:hypothetical protein